MTWIAKTWRWLVGAAVAIPALFALLMWGQKWKRRAATAERARAIAWEAAEAARVRGVQVAALAHAESQARKVLASKLDAAEAKIAAREADVQALPAGAERVNAAFPLEDHDGPSLGEGPVVESEYTSGAP